MEPKDNVLAGDGYIIDSTSSTTFSFATGIYMGGVQWTSTPQYNNNNGKDPFVLDTKEELDKGDWIISNNMEAGNPSISIHSKNGLVSYAVPKWLMDIIKAEKVKATVKTRKEIYSAMKKKEK